MRGLVCPQCESRIEHEHVPCPIRDASGTITQPNELMIRCDVCVAWIRIEGWSEWSATHYTMTPYPTSTAALEAFPRGPWLAVADTNVKN